MIIWSYDHWSPWETGQRGTTLIFSNELLDRHHLTSSHDDNVQHIHHSSFILYFDPFEPYAVLLLRMADLDFHLVDNGEWENAFLRLTRHPSARNRVVATQELLPGTVVLTDTALSCALLADQKSIRCDACLRRAGEALVLRKCSGCVEYWYCGEDCMCDGFRSINLGLTENRSKASLEIYAQTHVQEYC